MDPEKGYIKDDSIVLEVQVVADAPHGVRLVVKMEEPTHIFLLFIKDDLILNIQIVSKDVLHEVGSIAMISPAFVSKVYSNRCNNCIAGNEY